MRLLFLCNHYPPLHVGGYEELCQDVARGLRRRGHQVTVLTSRPRPGPGIGLGAAEGGGGADGADEEPKVLRVLETEVAVGDPLATPRLILGRAGRAARNRRRLVESLATVQPEAAVVWALWNLSPDIAAGLEAALGPRVLYYVADYWPSLPDAVTQHLAAPSRRPISRLAKRLLAAGLARPRRRLADGLRMPEVACVSQAVLDALRSAGVTMGRADVIHNGIDPAQFQPAGDRPLAPPLRLLLAGRLAEDKGVLVAVEALALARSAGHDVALTLAGAADPAVDAALGQAVDRLGLRDHLRRLGRLPRQRVPALVAGHHVLLAPSLWPDPLPRSAQEGMAAGLAVVASRIGGLPELIRHDESGLLVPPGDAAALARAIGRLAADPALRQRLAEAGRRRIGEAFDIRRTVEAVDMRLKGMVGGPDRGLPRT